MVSQFSSVFDVDSENWDTTTWAVVHSVKLNHISFTKSILGGWTEYLSSLLVVFSIVSDFNYDGTSLSGNILAIVDYGVVIVFQELRFLNSGSQFQVHAIKYITDVSVSIGSVLLMPQSQSMPHLMDYDVTFRTKYNSLSSIQESIEINKISRSANAG